MKINLIYILVMLSLAIKPCNLFESNQPKENEIPIARVYNKYLYKSDIDNTGLQKKSLKDAYVNTWIKEQLFLHKAENNLHSDLIDIEKQVEEYRNTLVNYNYEKYLIRQNLETNVDEADILLYYENYKDKFILKDNVFKPKYIKVNANDEIADSLVNWIESEDVYFSEKFNTYALKHTGNYSLGSDWFNIREFIFDLPFNNLNDDAYMQKNTLFKKEVNNDLHLLYVIDFGNKADIASVDYAKNEIINIILNNRKINYIEEVKKLIYKEAFNKDEIKIYK